MARDLTVEGQPLAAWLLAGASGTIRVRLGGRLIALNTASGDIRIE